MFEQTPQQGQMDTAAISLHEIFSSYMRAGFTEEQAFKLCLIYMKAILQPPK